MSVVSEENFEGELFGMIVSGIRNDQFLHCDVADHENVLSRDRVKLSYTNKGLPSDETKSAISTFLNTLSDEKMGEKAADPVPEKKNEGFTTAGQVQFVATAWDFKNKELPFTGALHVLQIIFSYDYLWINVRVKGGAYGAMCDFGREGVGVFTSYRDPNLGKTYDIYRNACDYVREFDCSDRDMLKYIIGTISKADMPLKIKRLMRIIPVSHFEKSFHCYTGDILKCGCTNTTCHIYQEQISVKRL